MIRFISACCWLAFCAPTAFGQGDWGTLHGRVVLSGDAIPQRKAVQVNRDESHCLANGPILSDELVVNKDNHGVRWAFVWLAPLEKSGPPLAIQPDLKQFKEKQVFIDQPCCMFVPHAIAIREGQEVVVKNSAPITHNTHWTGALKNPGGNRIAPAGQSLNIEGLKADKYPIKLSCDIHPWMSGWIRVFEHPYFAVTDANGAFEIKSAPLGNVRLVVWQEAVGWVTPRKDGGEPGVVVTVKEGDTDLGRIEMKPPK